MSQQNSVRLAVLLAMTSLAACNSSDDKVDLDSQLQSLIAQNSLTGDPSRGRNLPSINTPLAQLGKKLFFSKALGGDKDSACVSCHHPSLGGGDGLSLPTGVMAANPDLLGPGRMQFSTADHYDGGPNVPRNAPTTFNIGMWDSVLFLDGRTESLGKTPKTNGDDGKGIRSPDSLFGIADPLAGTNLAATQSRFPSTSIEEMRGYVFALNQSNEAMRTALVKRLSDQVIPNTWGTEFERVFGDSTLSYARIAEAIGAYERSQVFINTPWKRYIEGDRSALSDSAKQGAALFFTSVAQGGAGCNTCHTGDFFTDEKFHVLALPQIGRGKGDGVTLDDDFGRYRESKQADDKYAFRTLSLLNVEVTGPYGHDGAYNSLEDIIRHNTNPEAAVAAYDFSLKNLDSYVQHDNALANTQAALAQFKSLQSRGVSKLTPANLSDAQVTQLADFLRSLTDPCVKDRSCLAAWIPDNKDSGVDGLQLNAVDAKGNPL
jgi:cytochrome c peroxidase